MILYVTTRLPIDLYFHSIFHYTTGERAARAFARNFAARSALPIVLCDERLSTAAVTRTLLDADASRKRRAALVDKMAAAYILQGALDRMQHLGEK